MNWKNLLRWTVASVIVFGGFIACEDDPAPDPILPEGGANGVFILNEGAIGKGNSGITFYDYKKDTTIYDITNGSLGDTGQDILLYGSKLYVSVSASSLITVLDAYSKTVLKRIEVKNGNQPRDPRYLAAYSGKVYVTTWDGYAKPYNDGSVIRIDTTSLQIEAESKVGPYPEGIAAVNGKLYVANSDGMNFETGPGNTLSIVDVASFKQEKVLTVGTNPYIVRADAYGDIYLTYQGNFDGGGFQKINTKTNEVINFPDVKANSKFVISGDSCYFYGVTYDNNTTVSFGVFNVKTETLTPDPIITDGTIIKVPYGIGVHPDNGDVYISSTDYSNPGTVFVFGRDGKKKNTIDAGISANSFAFY